MATDTNTMATLDTANNANKNTAIDGSSMPHPRIVHPPLTSQMSASGVPISQNVHHRATWPVASLARNFMG